VGFAALAPLASAAVPLAGLLWASRPRARREIVAAGVATGIGLWWLLEPGELPDQFLRAAVLLTTTAFVLLSARTHWTFMHRALGAVAFAVVAGSAMLPILGSSWSEIRWWVEYQQGVAYRQMIGLLAAMSGDGGFGASTANVDEFGARLASTARMMGQFAAGVIALQILAGLSFATAVYRRVVVQPLGPLPGRFRALRFSEHLGWAAVLSLVVVVLPKLAAIKLVAANVLLVAGVLYALRGAAVALFGLQLLGAGGVWFWTAAVLVGVLMLPVVVGSAILIGVIDAGVNLRRRWSAAASR
jgi:hypothetical protein